MDVFGWRVVEWYRYAFTIHKKVYDTFFIFNVYSTGILICENGNCVWYFRQWSSWKWNKKKFADDGWTPDGYG